MPRPSFAGQPISRPESASSAFQTIQLTTEQLLQRRIVDFRLREVGSVAASPVVDRQVEPVNRRIDVSAVDPGQQRQQDHRGIDCVLPQSASFVQPMCTSLTASEIAEEHSSGTQYDDGERFISGRIKSFYPEKGFGFIACDTFPGEDIFFHANAIDGPPPEKCASAPGLVLGPVVEFAFERKTDKKGRPRAFKVSILREGPCGRSALMGTSSDLPIDDFKPTPPATRLLQELSLLLTRGSDGLCMRPDGFAKLNEALSVDSLQDIIEAAVPGSAKPLNTSGYGGPMSTNLLCLIRDLIRLSQHHAHPLEFWDSEAADEDLWIRAVAQNRQTITTQSTESNTIANVLPTCTEFSMGTDLTSVRMSSNVDNDIPTAPATRLLSDLTTLLRYGSDTLCMRPDGYAKLSEALSVDSLQETIEAAVPGSALPLNTNGFGGSMCANLVVLIHDLVRLSQCLECSLEFWDPQAESEELWIRAIVQAEQIKADVAEVPTATDVSSQSMELSTSTISVSVDDDGFNPTAPAGRLLIELTRLLRDGSDTLCQRPDGYAKLNEALSVDSMQDSVEAAVPGSAKSLNTSGYGGPMSSNLLALIRDLIRFSQDHVHPLELYDAEAADEDLWIRAVIHDEQPNESSAGPPTALSFCSNGRTGTDSIVYRGKVKAFYPEKEFGFIACDAVPGVDVFLHTKTIEGTIPEKCLPCKEPVGPTMEFEIDWKSDKNGRPRAQKARIVDHDISCNLPTPELQAKSEAKTAGACDDLIELGEYLARELARLLQSRIADEGLCVRPDGFAKLDEALSVKSMQEAVEKIAPGSSQYLNTGGYGGQMPSQLVTVAREAIVRSQFGASPRLEFWDDRADGQDLWVRIAIEEPASCIEESTPILAEQASVGTEELPPHLTKLSRCLASLLRHNAAAAGLHPGADDYLRLDEVLSASWMKSGVESIVPGYALSKGGCNAAPAALIEAVREVVAKSFSKGRARFELKEENTGELSVEKIWIRAAYKPHKEQSEFAGSIGGNERIHWSYERTTRATSQNGDGRGSEIKSSAWWDVKRYRGKLRAYNADKGYGFIACDEPGVGDVFLHNTAIAGSQLQTCVGRPGTVPAGPEIEFELGWNKGRPVAVNACAMPDTGNSVPPPENASVEVDCKENSSGNVKKSNPPQLVKPRAKPASLALSRTKIAVETAIEDVLHILPEDAPAEVRSYLTSLVTR